MQLFPLMSKHFWLSISDFSDVPDECNCFSKQTLAVLSGHFNVLFSLRPSHTNSCCWHYFLKNNGQFWEVWDEFRPEVARDAGGLLRSKKRISSSVWRKSLDKVNGLLFWLIMGEISQEKDCIPPSPPTRPCKMTKTDQTGTEWNMKARISDQQHFTAVRRCMYDAGKFNTLACGKGWHFWEQVIKCTHGLAGKKTPWKPSLNGH